MLNTFRHYIINSLCPAMFERSTVRASQTYKSLIHLFIKSGRVPLCWGDLDWLQLRESLKAADCLTHWREEHCPVNPWKKQS